MRIALVISLVLAAFSCGGAQKPSETAADTSSLEATGGTAKDKKSDKTDAPAAPPAAVAESPAATTAKDDAPATAPTPSHPAPTVTGMIDGKPFSPKVARVMGKVQKDGRIVIALEDAHADCATAAPAPGDATLTMLVPWENGYKVDLGSLKRSTRAKPSGEITFSRTGAGGKKEISATFKPSGTVTLVKAPTEPNATGKMKLDLQSGEYMLAGDLDVLVCVATK